MALKVNNSLLAESILGEDGEYIKLPNAFSYSKLNIDSYGLFYIDEKEYAIATTAKPTRGTAPKENGKYSMWSAVTSVSPYDVTLLLSLLDLRHQIDILYISSDEAEKACGGTDDGIIKFVDDVQYAKKKIIDWCIKHGFPFILESMNDILLQETHDMGFEIIEFTAWLHFLVDTFENCCVLPNLNGTELDYKSKILRLEHAVSRLDLVHTLQCKGGNISLSFYAPNLFQAALYQLILLITRKAPFTVDRCIECGIHFKKTKKSKTYCSQACRQKKYRRKHGEGEINAK